MAVLDQVSRLAPTVQQQLGRFQREAVAPLQFGAEQALETVNAISRSPWILTCDLWARNSTPRYIIMNINPKDLDIDIPVRGSQGKTAAGTVTYIWRDASRQGTIFDEFAFNFTMQSGSLLPVVTAAQVAAQSAIQQAFARSPNFTGKDQLQSLVTQQTAQIPEQFNPPKGLEVFYSFLELYNAPKINPTTGEPNYIRLIMGTLLFPKLTVKGMFRIGEGENLAFGQSTDTPTNIEWKVSLIVTGTTPSLTAPQLSTLIQEWKNAGGSTGFRSPPSTEELTSELGSGISTEAAEAAQQQTATEKELTDRQNALKAESDAKQAADEARKAEGERKAAAEAEARAAAEAKAKAEAEAKDKAQAAEAVAATAATKAWKADAEKVVGTPALAPPDSSYVSVTSRDVKEASGGTETAQQAADRLGWKLLPK